MSMFAAQARQKNGHAKLAVSNPGDALEHEADRVAQRVAATPVAATVAATAAASPNAGAAGGRPLPPAERSFFEARLGHDFSKVRIHTDDRAAAGAQRMHARAYTLGDDIAFAAGNFAPATPQGQRLLAHELTHVVQQRTGAAPPSLVQRQAFGPEATGTPPNWPADVGAATTPAMKAALLQQAMGLTVVDKTTESAADASPTAAHLVAYTSASATVNYDDGLGSKTSPVDHRTLNVNAGYTLNSGANTYIVFGPRALKASDFFWSRTVLNHEFDHVRQQQSGSALRGNESELDAWTSTFTRDFHRSYVLRTTGPSTAYVDQTPEWLPLLFYYEKPDVSAAQRDACVARITTYYTNTIQPHAAHTAVFKFWVHRSIKSTPTTVLATRLNTDLHLGIDPTAGLATTRQFPLGTLQSLTYPSGPSVDQPTGVGGAPPPPPRRP